MTVQGPTPFPAEGVRRLSPREQFEAVCARSSMDSMTACESQLHVGIFFDGTGNNMKLDYEDPPPEQRKHTNVVKLFQAFPHKPEKGCFAIYIPGVGTPFPEIGDSNHPDQWLPNWGSIGAEMGAHRILWALLQLINVPSRFHRGVSFPLIFNTQAHANLSILPGRDMYHAAFKAGVPLPAFDSLKDSNPDLAKSLTPSDELVRIYNAYLKDAAVRSGSVEEVHRKHMALYHSFRFKYRNEFERLPFVEKAPPEHKGWLRRTQAGFIERLNHLTRFDLERNGLAYARTSLPVAPLKGPRSAAMNPTFDPAAKAVEFQKNANGHSSDGDARLVDVALNIQPGALTPDMERMFANLVHDSLAGFIGMKMDEYRYNNIGLAKYRVVFKGND